MDESAEVHWKTEHDDDVAFGDVNAFFEDVCGDDKVDVVGPEAPKDLLLKLAYRLLFLGRKRNMGHSRTDHSILHH